MDKDNLNQKIVNVQAYKYDGRLYRQWNGTKIIEDNDDYVCCLLYKTKVVEDDGQKWIIKEPTLWFFSKKYFYNFTVIWKKEGLYYYINLASPFFYENKNIKYIDFDFDIKLYPGKPFHIVDHYDFERNKGKWYSYEIIDVIYETIAIIAKKYHNREDFFDPYYVYNLFDSLIMMNEINESNFNFDDNKKDKQKHLIS